MSEEQAKSASREEPPVPEGPDSPSSSGVSIKSEQSSDAPVEGVGHTGSPEEPASSPSTSASGSSTVDQPKGKHQKPEVTDQQKKKLISALQERYKNNLPGGDTSHRNQKGTEHIIRDDKKPETFTQVSKISEIFKETEGQKLRTVLTVGETGIGKSYHVQRFLKKWAAGKSGWTRLTSFLGTHKDDEEIIFLLNISKLTSLKKRELSLVGLLHHLYPEVEKCKISDIGQLNVLLVLDGLDALQPPLDFDNTKTLSDVQQSASVDVLLTNLIRGNLLPSARLWITSQPSAARKLPDKCVHRWTEIRWTDQQKLISALKKRYREGFPGEDTSHRNQKSTEHIIRDVKTPETFTQVSKISEIFKETEGQKIRTVLTVGETKIGKSYHVQKFIKEWAAGKSVLTRLLPFLGTSKDDEGIIILFDMSKLDSLKGREFSFVELLRHLYPEMNTYNISDFEKLNTLLVLDGLDALKSDLGFDNNDIVSDVQESASVDVLLTNLIRGTLLPSAQLWITSQRPAARKLPVEFVHRWTEIRDKGINKLLTEELKKKNLSQHERKLKELDTDTELYQIYEDIDDQNIISSDELFQDSGEKKTRSVLTKGEPKVGKTYQTLRFMVDWAKGEVYQNIDFIVPLDLSELNSEKHQKRTMKDLLHRYLNPSNNQGVLYYDECKLLFILDGLEKCKLPLDFAKTKELTDMEERASMDELLTNLIKGNLFPSAHIWIISQPSGVDKIPPEYIQKVTECRVIKEKVIQQFKKEILSQYENKLQGLEIDTELFEIHGAKDKKHSWDELFQDSKGKKTRKVLTKGVPGVGKTYQTWWYMVDWANRRVNQNIDFVVPLDLSELNSKASEIHNMKDLLHRFLSPQIKRGTCHYDQCRLLFVLDGLEKWKLALDFAQIKELTDTEERASMDELLTNLIKGNLLPSAHIWIISQPSGVEKIPSEYIQKVTECRGKVIQQTLSNDLKLKILQHENKLQELKIDTELFEIQEAKDKGKKIMSLEALFPDTKKKRSQRVLMKGVPGVGKTYQTWRHMVDWARGNTNRNIDFIVSVDLSELNSKGTEMLKMKDLLHHFLNPQNKRGSCYYDKCQLLVVLDGLEKCELPLDFAQNKDLTDMEERASMDVLLTNLIKGNLLPSAHIWIISQPSGVAKIPSEYIQKVTECRETLERRKQLISTLRKRFREKIGNGDKNNQKNTEHIMREEKSDKISDKKKNQRAVATSVTQITTVSDIFKETEGQTIRTVLTVGETGIGKTFHVERLLKEWADHKSLYTRIAKSLWGSERKKSVC
ncbi:uncharacterized protein LOC121517126 [Cheilinus undulatus]|uniref:uncharacterized protein LOC121517126 n=1 Tax=Cheilinus undulatus TaxID=241271 RepID=UPI001BD2A488|nr:uncharacterized protein LOC121517126 [Cheilinus undulatus]